MTSTMISDAGVMAIAAMCHAANRSYCRSLGDDSQDPWESAPDYQKESAVAGVRFHLANPDAGDAASHESWLKHKEAEGWKYGEDKDGRKKTHPCMVPFDQLPPEQQFKDALFRTIVHAAAPMAASHDALAGARDDLTARLAKAEKRASVRARGKSAKARAAGPVGERPDTATLFDLVSEEGHEIVFSDGDREIVALEPLAIGGDAWEWSGRGVILREKVTLKPMTPVTLAGFALLDGKGKQIAWCAMAAPLTIAPGQEVALKRQIIF